MPFHQTKRVCFLESSSSISRRLLANIKNTQNRAKLIHAKLLPYQKRCLFSQKPYVALIGGTGSGKTFLLPYLLFYKMCQYPGEEFIVSAPTREMLKRNPLKTIKQFLDHYNIAYELNKADLELQIEYGLGTVYFISAETPDRLQGLHPKCIFGDEAGLYSMLWWETAVQRRALKQGQIFLLTTPYSMNWLKTEVWDRAMAGDQDFHIENPISTDNPFYPVAEFERAKEMLPEWKFKMLFLGQFTRPAGLIYEDYELLTDVRIDDSYFIFGGVDFGFNNPFAVLWIAEKAGEFIVFEEFKQIGLTLDDIQKVLTKRKCVYYADPENKLALESLGAMGIDIRPAEKNVLDGITYVQMLFKTKQLKIFKECKHVLDEINTYQWEVDRTGQILDKPRKSNDHLMDCLRYALVTRNADTGPPVAGLLGFRREITKIFANF